MSDTIDEVVASENKAQYDKEVKELLGSKKILARILIKTVDEFKGMKRTRNGHSQVIINIEAQKSEPTEYWIINRGFFSHPIREHAGGPLQLWMCFSRVIFEFKN